MYYIDALFVGKTFLLIDEKKLGFWKFFIYYTLTCEIVVRF